VVDTKVRLNVKLLNLENIEPRETFTLGIEVADVDRTAAAMIAAVVEQKGRSHGAHVNQERDGRKTINIFFDVPLAAANTVVTKFRSAGVVRTERAEQNQQVPDIELAVARLQVVLSNASPIVGNDEGLSTSMKTALGYSFRGFAWSVAWIGSGLLFLAPWTALAGGVWLATSVVRRKRRTPESAAKLGRARGEEAARRAGRVIVFRENSEARGCRRGPRSFLKVGQAPACRSR